MRVLTGWITFLEEDHGDEETCAIVEHASWQEMTDEELDIVEAAQANPECKRVIQLTVAQQDGVAKLPPAAKAPEVEVVEEPVVKRAKKAEVPPAAPKAKLADVVNAWSDN